MIRSIIFFTFFALWVLDDVAQNQVNWDQKTTHTFLVEKIGTRHRYGFEPGDLIKIRTRDRKVLHSYLWTIGDSTIEVGQSRPVPFREIESVYPQFHFINKLGTYMVLSGIAYFAIVSFDHLINNEIVFTKDIFIAPAALFAGGFVTLSLSQKRCRIGDRWKMKVVGVRVN